MKNRIEGRDSELETKGYSTSSMVGIILLALLLLGATLAMALAEYLQTT
jgi:hypothetical protein